MKVMKVFDRLSVHRGKIGECQVLHWEGSYVVVLPGTVAYKYLAEMPLDDQDLVYSNTLFTRFVAGASREALWSGMYMHAMMWDAVCVMGLDTGALFVLPNNDEVQKALLLGKGILRKLFNIELADFADPNWRDKVEYYERSYCTPDPLHWVQHAF